MVKYTNISVDHLKIPQELHRAHAVRRTIFILEQGYSETIEMDNIDDICQHWVATCDVENEDGTIQHNVDIGVVRMIPKPDGVAKLGRLGVIKDARGYYIGQKLVQAFVDYCKQNEFHTIVLHSQDGRQGFYEKVGFSIEKGDDQIFEEAGTPHVRMWMRNVTTQS